MSRKKSSKSPAPMMVVDSRVKLRIKEREDLRVDGLFVQALNDEVDKMLNAAIERCEANGRKTVRPADL